MKPVIGETQWSIQGPYDSFCEDEHDCRVQLQLMAATMPALNLCRFSICANTIVDDVVFAGGLVYPRDAPEVHAETDRVVALAFERANKKEHSNDR